MELAEKPENNQQIHFLPRVSRNIPARADASIPSHLTRNGRRAWVELTAFQRDCLEAVARRERDDRPCDELGIMCTLGYTYPTVTRTRLEPNLRVLVGRGLLDDRDGSDGATAYRLTDAGRALLLLQRAERVADSCVIGAARTGADAATVRGDGTGDG
ncbi:PadR family transcriptional regulator [Natrinema sp. DC36]|uniref:PadR family transcriptional regulator n=1 Tax=Natrinema sp. DC36 TaxID=2878680 RepID=UPI001CF0500F|nr:PadR family transcriptional regulator [Natrinema sp. DC36]